MSTILRAEGIGKRYRSGRERPLADLLAVAPPGMFGWNVAADPMLAPLGNVPERQALLALIASRAA